MQKKVCEKFEFFNSMLLNTGTMVSMFRALGLKTSSLDQQQQPHLGKCKSSAVTQTRWIRNSGSRCHSPLPLSLPGDSNACHRLRATSLEQGAGCCRYLQGMSKSALSLLLFEHSPGLLVTRAVMEKPSPNGLKQLVIITSCRFQDLHIVKDLSPCLVILSYMCLIFSLAVRWLLQFLVSYTTSRGKKNHFFWNPILNSKETF